jgi:DME family drug/metabolite transporter
MSLSSAPARAAAPGKLAGRLWVLAAALMWSSSGLFAKQTLFDEWPADKRGLLFAFWRALFAALVLLPMVRRPRWSPHLVPLVACFVLMNVTFLTALVRTTAANAIWLQATAPWWVFLLSVFLLRQPVVRRDLIPLAFGVVGVGLILFFEISRRQEAAGVVCGMAAGVFYAGVVVFLWRLGSDDPAWLVALNHAIVAAALFPCMLSWGYWPSPLQLAVLAGFGIFQMAIPYVLLIRGLRTISSQEATAIGLIEPVLMPLWVYLAGLESPQWWTIAGASLILAGLVLRYVVWELVKRP